MDCAVRGCSVPATGQWGIALWWDSRSSSACLGFRGFNAEQQKAMLEIILCWQQGRTRDEKSRYAYIYEWYMGLFWCAGVCWVSRAPAIVTVTSSSEALCCWAVNPLSAHLQHCSAPAYVAGTSSPQHAWPRCLLPPTLMLSPAVLSAAWKSFPSPPAEAHWK